VQAIDTAVQESQPDQGKLKIFLQHGGQEYRIFDAWCMDCGQTFDNYMVHPHIWQEATGIRNERGYLCLECLEHRLGRNLQPGDFPRLPVNRPLFFLLDRQA
jgi:DNA-directed RNA polymerase subunit RPC12/RpoP